MTNETNRPPSGENTPSSSAPPSAAIPNDQPKPRFALFVATASGLGYLPKAPGTWGSLAGLALALVPSWAIFGAITLAVSATDSGMGIGIFFNTARWYLDPFLWVQMLLTISVAAIGVWSANRAAKYWQQKDPQRVVIDEVSGQHLVLLIGCGVPIWWRAFSDFPWTGFPPGLATFRSPLNWKYLLLGFILFRVFDIWKPFPARQAESLPGGWGIMADDWIAAVYAGLGLWMARALGL
jgi:phosphatidylglycerophosphatase A